VTDPATTHPLLHADVFTHVRIIIGMVLGLSLARLINGVMQFVQHPELSRIYPVHLGWVIFLLISIIHFWWFEFYLSTLAVWHFAGYLFVIVYAMLFVALAALLFPDRMNEYDGFQDYFEKRKRWFYGALALCFLFDIADTLIKGPAYFAALGPEYLIQRGVLIAAALAAMFIPGMRYQLLFVTAATIYEASWIFRTYGVLGSQT